MTEYIDQMKRTIRLDSSPRRIVSLVPSQTELLYDLNLGQEVVGITKFCIHPEVWFRSKERVGGTKKVDIEKVKQLQPDLIIGNKEENTREDIELLERVAPVWMSDIFTLEDSLDMIVQVGQITNRVDEAIEIHNSIVAEFEKLETQVGNQYFSCLYFMWKDPYFTVGSNTFIDDMIQRIGGKNLQQQARYPIYEFNDNDQPDVVFLSTEPYPFASEHVAFFQRKFPNAKVVLVDGEMFSWYGSRLQKVPSYFLNLLREIK